MELKVLGTGCKKCKTLESIVTKVVEDNKIDATITKIEDIMEIMQMGVMVTPALVKDGEIILKGRLPKESELLELLKA